jgi:hypothetical protein
LQWAYKYEGNFKVSISFSRDNITAFYMRGRGLYSGIMAMDYFHRRIDCERILLFCDVAVL